MNLCRTLVAVLLSLLNLRWLRTRRRAAHLLPVRLQDSRQLLSRDATLRTTAAPCHRTLTTCGQHRIERSQLGIHIVVDGTVSPCSVNSRQRVRLDERLRHATLRQRLRLIALRRSRATQTRHRSHTSTQPVTHQPCQLVQVQPRAIASRHRHSSRHRGSSRRGRWLLAVGGWLLRTFQALRIIRE